MTKLKNCNFETWSSNHTSDHKDKIYRELYPFKVFQEIEFAEELIAEEQIVEFNYAKYYIEIQGIKLQENERYKATFSLSTKPKSKSQEWEKRSWNEVFQIIYSSQFDFITVFTKKEDSSKEYLKKFTRGSFEKIYANRSIPVSGLLFRTLVLILSEELFGEGDHNREFPLVDKIVDNDEHPRLINSKTKHSPIYSQGKDLWVCYSFNEEKAHRIGFYLGNYAKKLNVIYCNPTYTRHERCNYRNVEVLSLFEFAFRNSKQVLREYDLQIRLLQNHLNRIEEYSKDALLKEIKSPEIQKYDIYKSELMEALSIMKVIPQNQTDLFLYLSAMNLINGWINRQRKESNKNKELLKDMYSFKSYMRDTITYLLDHDLGAKIYLEPDFLIVELIGFQFSFHHIPLSQKMSEYLRSKDNVEIRWSGKRLQPIAPLLLRYARLLYQEVSSF